MPGAGGQKPQRTTFRPPWVKDGPQPIPIPTAPWTLNSRNDSKVAMDDVPAFTKVTLKSIPKPTDLKQSETISTSCENRKMNKIKIVPPHLKSDKNVDQPPTLTHLKTRKNSRSESNSRPQLERQVHIEGSKSYGEQTPLSKSDSTIGAPTLSKSASRANLLPPPPPRPPPPPSSRSILKDLKPLTSKQEKTIEMLKSRPRKRPDWACMMKEVENGKKLRHVVCNDRSAPLIERVITKVTADPAGDAHFVFDSEKSNVHNKLLKQIQEGVKLKSVKTNDRSKPVLEGLRKFRRQLTLEEQMQKAEQAPVDEVVPDEMDDIDAVRDDLQSTKQMLALELRNKEALERENKRLQARILNLEVELEREYSQKSAQEQKVKDQKLTDSLKKEAEQAREDAERLEKDFANIAEERDKTKNELEEMKRMYANLEKRMKAGIALGGCPSAKDVARIASQKSMDKPEPDESEDEETSQEESEDDDDPKVAEEKRHQREIKQIKTKIKNFKDKTVNSKKERQSLKNQIKLQLKLLAEEKKKFKHLQKEVDKMAKLMGDVEDDEDEIEINEKEDEETESEEISESENTEEDEDSDTDDEETPLEKRKNKLQILFIIYCTISSACTDIDDVAEAILHLEGTNWDLLAAINNVMPQNTQQLPSELNRDIEMIEEIKHVPKNSSEVAYVPGSRSSCSTDKVEILPGTSNSKSIEKILAGSSRLKEQTRILTFHINYLSKIFQIEISDTNSVGNLKLLIFNNTHIAPCQQQLLGWRKEPKGDSVVLKSLELPLVNELFLSPVTEVGDSSLQTMKLSERLSNTYTLNVKDEINRDTYKLNFPGTYTILDVKTNIYTLNNVPVRNQLWKGWPPTVKNDSVTLAQSGISIPEHNLSVERIPPKETKNEVVDLVDTDSSVDEPEDGEDFEDAPESFQVDDDIFIDYVQPTKNQHLIPDNIEDEIDGTMHFSEEYKKRYGLVHPNFFTGTFENAVSESCSKPPRERKLLAVYLHHDNSILTNVFCTQLLGFETVLQLLSANFIVWGWDCTYESNKLKFLTSIQQVLGVAAAVTIRNIEIDTMPILMIIMKSRSNTDVFTIIHGNVGVNELLTNLIEAVDVFQEQRQSDIEFEDERQARERVKEEQDQAYQESLAADRAKEEAKQLLEKIEKQRKEQAENKRLAEQARKEAHRLAVESSLPPEPAQDSTENVLRIKVRLPSGNFLERRFQSDAVLQTILNFLIVKGYPTEDYKVLSSWPRRDLTTMDTNLTLYELKFCPQETLILEER